MPIQVEVPLAQLASDAKKINDEIVFIIKDGRLYVAAADPSMSYVVLINAGAAIDEDDTVFAVSGSELAKVKGIKYDIDYEKDTVIINYLTKNGVEITKELAAMAAEFPFDGVLSMRGRNYKDVVVSARSLLDFFNNVDAGAVDTLEIGVKDGEVSLRLVDVNKKARGKIKALEPSDAQYEFKVTAASFESVVETLANISPKLRIGFDGEIIRVATDNGVAEAYLTQAVE